MIKELNDIQKIEASDSNRSTTNNNSQSSGENYSRTDSDLGDTNQTHLETGNGDNVQYYDEFIFGNSIAVKHPFKMGNLYTLFYINNAPLITIGFNSGALFFGLEIGLQVSFWFLSKFVFPTTFTAVNIIDTVVLISTTFAHCYIFLFNPGIPSRDLHASVYTKTAEYTRLSSKEKQEMRYCEICHIVTFPAQRVEHCDECNICVMKYDHHCFWTGKCIGKNNFWAFQIFLWGTLTYIFAFFITLLVWVILVQNNYKK